MGNYESGWRLVELNSNLFSKSRWLSADVSRNRMKLIDALEILKQPIAADTPQLKVYLACGFTPVHLETLLAAHLRLNFPQRRAEIATGLYGDLIGNLERLDPSQPQCPHCDD